MEPDTPPAILRLSLRLVARAYRWFTILFAVAPAVLILIGSLGVAFDAGNGSKAPYREQIAFGVLLYFWLSVVVAVGALVCRRSGFFAADSEVGLLTLRGAMRPTKVHITRWIRRSVRNPVPLGRDMKFILGIDASRHTVLVLPMLLLPESGVREFLQRTGLPVEGGWSERTSFLGWRAAFPPAPEQRPSQLQRWFIVALALMEIVALGLTFLVAMHVAG